MTARDGAISELLRLMDERGITLEDLAHALAAPSPQAFDKPKRKAGDVAMRVFTYLGGIFVLGGIGAYIAMFWTGMSSGMRIFSTLGIGFLVAVLSVIAMKENKHPRLILPLIILAAILETGGWGVFTDEMFPHGGDVRKAACLIFGIMAIQEWCTFSAFKRTSLVFFATMFNYSFLDSALSLAGLTDAYRWMLLGGSLISVSDWLSKSRHKELAGFGFLFAAFWFNAGLYNFVGMNIGWQEGAMAAGLSMCGLGWGLKLAGRARLPGFLLFVGSAVFYSGLFSWVWHTPFELLYLGVAIAMMYAHTILESRAILVTSTFAILGFIGYYTEEHFVHSVGWPIALILLGVAFLGVGAMAVRIGKRT